MHAKSSWALVTVMALLPGIALGQDQGAADEPRGHTLCSELIAMDEPSQTAFLRGYTAGLHDRQMLDAGAAVAAGRGPAEGRSAAEPPSEPPEIDATRLIEMCTQSPNDAVWSVVKALVPELGEPVGGAGQR